MPILSTCMFRRPLTLGGLASILVLSGILVGCNDVATRNTLDDNSQKARQGLDEAKRQPSSPVKRYDPLVVSDKIWAGSSVIKMHRGIPLPDRLEGTRGVTFVMSTPMALDDIAKTISQQTGVPVYLADASTAAKALGGGSSSSSAQTMAIAYEGPLSGFLERVSANFGVSWRFDGSSVTIKRFETRVFSIEALPGTQNVQEGMQDDNSSAGSGGSTGGSSTKSITQNSKFTLDMKSQMDEVGSVVTAMLGGTGSIVVSPTLGTITVTTTPEIMRLVADYIAQENQKISRQIAVNVEVYSVNLGSNTDFSIAFSGAIKALSRNSIKGVGVVPDINDLTSAATMNVAVLNSKDVGTAIDVFSALSQIGDTTKVARFPMVTLDNRPVARRIGKDIGYLASASQTAGTTTTSSSGVSLPTVTLTPGTIHQGFSVQLTPRLLDDGRILLQYSLSIIDLDALNCFSSQGFSCNGLTTADASLASGSAIQIPTTSNRIFVQQSVLKSGSTLIIGGAEEDDTTQNSQGLGDPYNYIFGGGQANAKAHTMVFFALTPQVLETPREGQL